MAVVDVNFNADTISNIISCHCRNLLATQFLPKKTQVAAIIATVGANQMGCG